MPTATLERPSFPKTITACHAELIKLRAMIDGDGLGDSVVKLRREVTALNEQVDQLENGNGKLEDQIAELEADVERLTERNGELEDAEEAIHSFLYEVETLPGRKFDVIHGGAADRAILSMFNAVGRQP